MTLLYCGNKNTQTDNAEVYRSAKPINATTCECYDYFGEECNAWCTAAPVKDIEIPSTTSNNTFKATCSGGRLALGCHISLLQDKSKDYWPAFYPTDGGSSCTCFHTYGAQCLAMCASNIANYEINEVVGNGTVIASCKLPGNTVLGCGSDAVRAQLKGPETFKTTRVSSSNSCECYNRYLVNCYSVCGQLSSTIATTTTTVTTTTSTASTASPSGQRGVYVTFPNRVIIVLIIICKFLLLSSCLSFSLASGNIFQALLSSC